MLRRTVLAAAALVLPAQAAYAQAQLIAPAVGAAVQAVDNAIHAAKQKSRISTRNWKLGSGRHDPLNGDDGDTKDALKRLKKQQEHLFDAQQDAPRRVRTVSADSRRY